MSDPRVDQLTDRCLQLETDNHKLYLQVLVLRGTVQKCLTVGTIPDSERRTILQTFLAAGGYNEVNSIPDGICDVCFKKGSVHQCQNCKRAYFCSVECEVTALQTHFEFCRAWREQTTSNV